MKEIKTVGDFLSWKRQIEKKYQSSFGTVFFYRGQADEEWPICPNVFRKIPSNYYLNEHRLLKYVQSVAWSVISDCKTPLETLVKLQHFGLPTRLLDITHNPLIALYMACSEKKSKNGCIYWGTTDSLCNDGAVSVIAKESFTEFINDVSPIIISEILINHRNISLEDLQRPYYVLPPYNNQRIINQKGAFIIPPLLSKRKIKGNYKTYPSDDIDYRKDTFDINGTGSVTIFKGSCLIKKTSKDMILKELSSYGINTQFIFPDKIDELMKEIVKQTRIHI